MSLLSDLKAQWAVDIQDLKNSADSLEARIEAAFEKGALAHAAHVIETDATDVATKIQAAIALGKSLI